MAEQTDTIAERAKALEEALDNQNRIAAENQRLANSMMPVDAATLSQRLTESQQKVDEQRQALIQLIEAAPALSDEDRAALQAVTEKDNSLQSYIQNTPESGSKITHGNLASLVDEVYQLQQKVESERNEVGGGHGAGNARRQRSEQLAEKMEELQTAITEADDRSVALLYGRIDQINFDDTTKTAIEERVNAYTLKAENAEQERANETRQQVAEQNQATETSSSTIEVDNHTGEETPAQTAFSGDLIAKGMAGERVRQLQQALKDLGAEDLVVDGIFGPKTEAQLRAFQQANNLDVDGIAGPETFKVLNQKLAQQQAAQVVPQETTNIVMNEQNETVEVPAANVTNQALPVSQSEVRMI